MVDNTGRGTSEMLRNVAHQVSIIVINIEPRSFFFFHGSFFPFSLFILYIVVLVIGRVIKN